ncbi:MAG: hypothetical protein ACRDN0_30985 [Trebonia sp.]
MVAIAGNAALAATVVHQLNGEGWRQAAELGLALVLSAAIGVESGRSGRRTRACAPTRSSASARPCSC